MDDAALRWKIRAQCSKRPTPLQLDADEYAAAESLVLLATSVNCFCATVTDTVSPIFPPKKHQELSHSAGDATPAAAIAKKQEAASPDTPLPPPYHSSQALGGHMTSHRIKIRNSAVPDTDKGRRSNSAATGRRVHECSCCHQTFATGQALGGHKRKHYDGPTLARKAAKCASTSFNRIAGDGSGESSHTGGATSYVRPNIDLNLPPPPERGL